MEQLFSSPAIADRISRLSRNISRDYENIRPVIIGILKGSFIFLSDLVRQLSIDADIDFTQVSSYGASTVSSGRCELIKDITMDIAGRHVLVVDDIVDTGLTLEYLRNIYELRKPASIKICCLIDKSSNRTRAITVDYAAFGLRDGFVVGYGLDLDGRYRGLPAIYRIDGPGAEGCEREPD